MRKLIKNITDRYKHAKMKNQLIIMYFAAVFVPILLVGIILVAGNARRLVTYHSDLLKANNNRIRSVLYEITSQIYSISGELLLIMTLWKFSLWNTRMREHSRVRSINWDPWNITRTTTPAYQVWRYIPASAVCRITGISDR